MSNITNDKLLDRASELLEEISDHPSGYDVLLSKAIESGDLDEVHRVVSYVEGQLAQDHFHQYDLVVW